MAKSRSIGGIYASLSLRDKDFREGIKRAKLSLKEIRDGQRGGLVNRDREGVQNKTDWSGMASGAGAVASGVGAAAVAFVTMNAAMAKVLSTYAGYDSLVRGLKVLDGTASATAARLEELRAIAKAPGLGFEQVVEADLRLRSTGLSAETSAKAIKGFGNALASVGGSKDDLKGVFLALGQISAKGKVSAEEINQLAERVPQIRQLMKDAFGTADTEALQKMGIDSKTFIDGIISQLEKLPRATGGAQNTLDNYTDSWNALKTQASEFGQQIAGSWIKDVTRAFDMARKQLLSFKDAMGLKTQGLQGADGKTEEVRMAENAAAEKLKIEQASALAENKVHNANLALWENLQEERTAHLKSEAEKRAAIEEDKNKSRTDALIKYNEESGILSAKLAGDPERIKTLEREKAIREKIAELMSAGFSEKEAKKPAEAMVDAYLKLEASTAAGPRDVNAYQSRGLSLSENGTGRAMETQTTLLGNIRDILSSAKTTRALYW